jgi:hypothetical protein
MPAEVSTQAVSSPAETADPFNGESPSIAEYNTYRETGELPARFKPAETAASATADAPEETAEETEAETPKPASESDTEEEVQEQPHKVSPAEKRIKQLLAEKKDLERKLADAAKPTQQSDSSTAQQPKQPQNFSEWKKSFKPSAWIEEYAKANPDSSYEDANFAMAVHLSEVRDQFKTFEQQIKAQQDALEMAVNEAKERYEDFDEIKDTFLGKVLDGKGQPLIPIPVLSIINDSPLMADVLYTIGSDEGELEKFVAMARKNPNQAIRYIARVENLIEEEFANQAGGNEATSGKAPEKQRTAAPAPPSPVGGSSSRSFDVNDESLSAEDWFRKRNAQLAKR